MKLYNKKMITKKKYHNILMTLYIYNFKRISIIFTAFSIVFLNISQTMTYKGNIPKKC